MKTKSLATLTKEAKKHMELVSIHSEKLGTVLMQLTQMTVEAPVIEEKTVKRGPGRPAKNKQEATKRSPGRPRKTETVKSTPSNRGTNRQDKNEAPKGETLDFSLKAEMKRIKEGSLLFNKWWSESTDEREIWKVENGTYLAVIEGFHSSGESGRYGITTRIYINPKSHLIPEELKGHINTAAVNRIRYVENKFEGLDYIEKQKAKIESQFFDELLPTVISDHGKKGSVYAFHLDKKIRKNFRELKATFKEKAGNSKLKNVAN